MIDGLNLIKADLNITQISLMESLIENGFKAHLDIHCNYWLKNQFIPLKKTYFEKRSKESCNHLILKY